MADNNVNIILSLQNEASKQLEQVKKELDIFTKKQVSNNTLLKRDQSQADAYYSKLDADRLKEKERISQAKIRLEKVLNKQAIELQKQMDIEDRKIFASKLARDRAVAAEEQKQLKLKLKKEQLLAKQQLLLTKQVEKAKKQAAKDAARAEITAIRQVERAEKNKLQTLKHLATLFRQIGSISGGAGLGLLGGGAFGGFLGSRGYEEAKEGARAEEIRRSFERTFGTQSGSILSYVRDTVRGVIDDTTLMREAIKENIEDISPDKMTTIFKLGGLASQRFGMDAKEGIELARKAVVEFDEQAMKELGILTKRDASYQTYLKVLDKSTKGLNAYARIEMQNAYILDRMNIVYGKNAKIVDDNFQGFQRLGSAAVNLKNAFTQLLNTAFGPMARTLGNWVQGVAELLKSFDATTGKATISKQLASIIGPGGVESVRRIAAGVLDLVDFIKGFISGLKSVFRPIIDFVTGILSITDKIGLSWKEIGKITGGLIAIFSLTIAPMLTMVGLSAIVASNFLKLYTTIQLLRGAGGISGIVSSLAGTAARTAATAAATGGGVAAGQVAAGGLSLGGLGTAAAITAPALLAGAATYYNTQKAIRAIDEASEQQMGYRDSSSTVNTAGISLPPSRSSASNTVIVKNDDLRGLLYQTNAHLRNIDEKTSKTNELTSYILDKPSH